MMTSNYRKVATIKRDVNVTRINQHIIISNRKTDLTPRLVRHAK